MKKLMLVICCLALALGAFACAQNEISVSSGESEGTVIATVDNVKITDADISKMLEGIRDPRQLMRFASEEGKKQLLDKLVDIELVAAAAQRDGMLNDVEVKKLIENYTKQVLFVAYLQKKLKETVQEIDEAAAKAYFDEHPDEFVQGEQVKASHILIKVAEDADDATVAAAKKKIEDLYKKAKAGADFAELAKANSDDPGTKNRGGSLGFFARGRMVPEFDEAAFGLDVGQISEPVRSKFGFHIIKVEDRKAEQKKTFEEVKTMLMRKLSMEQQQNAYETVVGDLRTAANIDIDEEALNNIKLPMPSFGMPGGGQMPMQLQGAQPGTP